MIPPDQSSIAIDESDSMEVYLHSTSSDICTGNIAPKKNMESRMMRWHMRNNSKKKKIPESDHSTK